MNYWERWIGDWKRKTAHLSAEAKGIYGELLDHEYATHKALPLDHDEIYRLAGARTGSECKATERVLSEFYEKTPQGYINKRAQAEIAKRSAYVEAQRHRANTRWGKVDADTGEIKPLKPKKTRVNGEHFALPDWIDAAKWTAWIAVRPARARTVSAQRAAVEELEKMRTKGLDANEIVGRSLANGWQGLFEPDKRGGVRSVAEANRAAADEFIRRGENGTG